jgi:hypothetical protein
VTSKSWACLLLSLSPLAKWLRQMGGSIVIAAISLFLPPAAEASAQAPLVAIQTRVVAKNSPNPYSTLVGTATYGATGAGPGYHVVVLDRTALTLVSNNTYGLDFTSLNSLSNDIMGLGSNVLVVISSIGPVGSLSSQAIAFLNNVAAILGGTGQGYIYGGTMSPSAYSLIGIPGIEIPDAAKLLDDTFNCQKIREGGRGEVKAGIAPNTGDDENEIAGLKAVREPVQIRRHAVYLARREARIARIGVVGRVPNHNRGVGRDLVQRRALDDEHVEASVRAITRQGRRLERRRLRGLRASQRANRDGVVIWPGDRLHRHKPRVGKRVIAVNVGDQHAADVAVRVGVRVGAHLVCRSAGGS